jgi:hypothetical protein
MDITLTLELSREQILQFEQNYLQYKRASRPAELDLELKILAGNYQRGYLTREEFQDIVQWKNPRFAYLADANTESDVNRVTRNGLRAVAMVRSKELSN